MPSCRGATKTPYSLLWHLPMNARRCPSADKHGGEVAVHSERHRRGSPPAAGTIIIGEGTPLDDVSKAISPREETANGPALSTRRRVSPPRVGISKMEEPLRNKTRVPSGENWGLD